MQKSYSKGINRLLKIYKKTLDKDDLNELLWEIISLNELYLVDMLSIIKEYNYKVFIKIAPKCSATTKIYNKIGYLYKIGTYSIMNTMGKIDNKDFSYGVNYDGNSGKIKYTFSLLLFSKSKGKCDFKHEKLVEIEL